MEVCGSAHLRVRKFREPGLAVKLLPPRWVKFGLKSSSESLCCDYIVNNKSDANDSVSIVEASQLPRLHALAVKSVA